MFGPLPLFLYLAPQNLDMTSLGFPFQTPQFGGFSGFGGFALFGGVGHAFDELLQALEGIFPVGGLGAVLLGFDDDHAFLCDALVIEGQQALLDGFRQAGGVDIEAQMECAGNLVDILPATALGTDGAEFDFGFRDLEGV